ncbi:sensor histidine kinase [Sediminispirochaeta smaragdinae]|uniref:histidine kinase n=1 Tax=Sediminispirochaeta smaragdinae (strain DSM 11293 / JCM 15392 / SEBR 4228) TaxID=573413 RepID=E1R0T5_SEDSS|nr:ATP-binding protein [Sediminispirochaeta smaragdinae]ADK80184.1 integral membrane sensor signal transduction histidine kinase [Sediminispirochaeta smaragdinae DSM 11293]
MRRISFRLLIFNLLLVFLPLGSMLYLKTYERQLLETQERAMVQEGRMLASAVADRAIQDEGLRILANLAGRMESRIRIVGQDGTLLADSAVDSPVSRDETMQAAGRDYEKQESGRQAFLYRLVVPPVNRLRELCARLLFPPSPRFESAEYYSGKSVLDGPEVRLALSGRYGASTRISSGGQRSVTLYSAIPIYASSGNVRGAVVVSRSTYRILENLYRIRLDIIVISLYSFAAALSISLILSFTITRPLRRLKDRAEELLSVRNDLASAFRDGFPALKRRDEIGDLGRALAELWGRLEKRIGDIDDFTSDTLHELKNPLSAIRSAAEVASSEADREGTSELSVFFRTILRSVARIDRLLGELREIGRIDAGIDDPSAEALDVESLVTRLEEIYRCHKRIISKEVELHIDNRLSGRSILINPERMLQLVGNLLDNALDFASSRVDLSLFPLGERNVGIRVEDDGPGIDPADAPHLFSRFFSVRERRGEHSGLGLSICRAIAERCGGRVVLEENPEENKEEGASFLVVLPASF